MLGYILKKLLYGCLVLFGVVTVVFFIFNLGGDPVENLVSENAPEDVKQAIRVKFNLDLPISQQYALYLNDLSPVSVHNPNVEQSRIFLDSTLYSFVPLIALGKYHTLVLKWPYLKRSYLTERGVSDIVANAFPGTAILAVTAIIIALILGITLGVFAAVRKDSLFDHAALVLSVLGMSGPSFFMAIIIAWLGGLVWYEAIHLPALPMMVFLLFVVTAVLRKHVFKKGKSISVSKAALAGILASGLIWVIGLLVGDGIFNSSFSLPGTGLSMTGSLYDVDVWHGEYINLNNLILPAITLGIRPLAVIVQLTRNSLLEQLEEDYVRTARAKGLSESVIVWKHALRNALNPVITAVSGWFASLLAGAVFVEFVFGWKGLGLEMYNALENDDLPVVMGSVIVIAGIFVVINILTDILYGVVDPRVRLR